MIVLYCKKTLKEDFKKYWGQRVVCSCNNYTRPEVQKIWISERGEIQKTYVIFKHKVCQINLPQIDLYDEPRLSMHEVWISLLILCGKILTRAVEYRKSFHKSYGRRNYREFDKYLHEPLLHRTHDRLLWWRLQRSNFPPLKLWAIVSLCIPVTSVPCERIFSNAGMIITEKRSRLSFAKMKK